MTLSRLIPMKVSAACNRVQGSRRAYRETVSVEFSKKPSQSGHFGGLREISVQHPAGAQSAQRPSAARSFTWISLTGLSRAVTSTGRKAWRCLLAVSVNARCLHWKFLCMGHNTVRGAAGCRGS